MANLRVDNISGTGGRNAIDGSVFFNSDGHGSTNNINALSLADSTDWYFDGDFTFECWINPGKRPTTSGAFFGQWVSGGGTDRNVQLYIGTNGVVTGYMNRSTTNYSAGSVAALPVGEWSHIALVLESSTLRFYLNGVQTATASVSGTQNNGTSKFFVGAEANASGNPVYAFNGYLSNVRVIKGTALYAGGTTFTPPTEKLKPIDGTVLLCCQDSDDPTQEATGKTITGHGNLDYSLRDQNLITNGNFDTSSVTGWTLASGSRALGTGQSGTFGDGNHLVLTSGTMTQAFTTVIGRTYFVNAQSNGADNSFISTTTSSGDAIITDIRSSPQTGNGVRGQKSFVATQTTYYVILTGGGGGGNFDTVSVYEAESPKAQKVLPPVGVDEGVTFEGDTKINSQGVMYFPTGDTSQRGRGRAVSWWGIYNTSGNYTKDVDYFDIQSLGTTTKFGEISDTVGLGAGMSSSTRGVFAGGTKPGVGNMNLLEYITIATTGNAVDFGGVSTTFRYGAGISNQTRGLIAGAYQGSGASGTLNTIQYITIANLGDTLDFGDMVADGGTGVQGMGSCSSPTRGITFGGGTPSKINEMNYITIMSTGNSVDFGDLSDTRYLCQGVSSSTRGVIGGGDNSGAVNIIEYITIATTGNATDFGDLMSAREHSGSEGGSNGIRGVFVGGGDWPAGNNTMEYITIATTGNTKDFGDSRTAISAPYGSTTVSDCHGGLS